MDPSPVVPPVPTARKRHIKDYFKPIESDKGPSQASPLVQIKPSHKQPTSKRFLQRTLVDKRKMNDMDKNNVASMFMNDDIILISDTESMNTSKPILTTKTQTSTTNMHETSIDTIKSPIINGINFNTPKVEKRFNYPSVLIIDSPDMQRTIDAIEDNNDAFIKTQYEIERSIDVAHQKKIHRKPSHPYFQKHAATQASQEIRSSTFATKNSAFSSRMMDINVNTPYPDATNCHVGWTTELKEITPKFTPFKVKECTQALDWSDYTPQRQHFVEIKSFSTTQISYDVFIESSRRIWGHCAPESNTLLPQYLDRKNFPRCQMSITDYICPKMQKLSHLLTQWLHKHQSRSTFLKEKEILHTVLSRRKRVKHDSFIAYSDEEEEIDMEEMNVDLFIPSDRILQTDALPSVNAVLLQGPFGCGKSSVIECVINALGYNVLELSSSVKRSGKDILNACGEATQSHHLKKKRGDRDVRMTVLVVEDAEVLFEEDAGFWSAIEELVSISKIPILLTCQANPIVKSNKCIPAGCFTSLREKICCIEMPTLDDSQVLSLALQTLLTEGVLCDESVLKTEILKSFTNGDVRRFLTILNMQYIQRKEENAYIHIASSDKCEPHSKEPTLSDIVAFLDNQSFLDNLFCTDPYNLLMLCEDYDDACLNQTFECIEISKTYDARVLHRDPRISTYPILFSQKFLEAMNSKAFPCALPDPSFSDMSEERCKCVSSLYYDYEMISRRLEIMTVIVPFLKHIALSMYTAKGQENGHKRLRNKKMRHSFSLTDEELPENAIATLLALKF